MPPISRNLPLLLVLLPQARAGSDNNFLKGGHHKSQEPPSGNDTYL
jgi:hypothetical protein